MSLAWLKTARVAGQVKRAHIVPLVQSYSVAEHVYNSMLIGHEICRLMDVVDDGTIAKYILTHDIEEVYTGDLPAYIKRHEDLAKAISRIEVDWCKENLPDHHAVGINDMEERIAKLADKIELVMFCIDELNMGNRHPTFLNMCTKASSYMMQAAGSLGDIDVSMMCSSLYGEIERLTGKGDNDVI